MESEKHENIYRGRSRNPAEFQSMRESEAKLEEMEGAE